MHVLLAAFERFLGVAVVIAEAQELAGYHGILDVLQVILQRGGEAVHLVGDGLLDLRLQQAEVVLRPNVAVQHAAAPALATALLPPYQRLSCSYQRRASAFSTRMSWLLASLR